MIDSWLDPQLYVGPFSAVFILIAGFFYYRKDNITARELDRKDKEIERAEAKAERLEVIQKFTDTVDNLARDCKETIRTNSEDHRMSVRMAEERYKDLLYKTLLGKGQELEKPEG